MAKPGPDLAAVFGSAKGGKKPPAADAETPADDSVPPDFEAAALEAFPDMGPAELSALKRAIEACVAAKDEGEYD
jgi:hypothetical protein